MAQGKVHIEGLKKLDDVLRQLGPAIYSRHMKQAVGAASRPIISAARRIRQSTPTSSGWSKTGELGKSIKAKIKTYPRKQRVIAVVGPAKSKTVQVKKGNKTVKYNPGNISHLVEEGHYVTHGKIHLTKAEKAQKKESGTITGRAKEKPFLKPAYDANKNKCNSEMAKKMQQGVDKEARRLFKK